MGAKTDYSTIKYLIKARFKVEGAVEMSDVIGAVFGQTEGLLGENMDLRTLQEGNKIGRIKVVIESRDDNAGYTTGIIEIPSSLNKEETAVLAAALETVDRVGPSAASVKLDTIEDVRAEKRKIIASRAAEILKGWTSTDIADVSSLIRERAERSSAAHKLIKVGSGLNRTDAGPGVPHSKEIIFVEGRSDVIALLQAGFNNALSINGTNIPDFIKDYAKKKVVTAFLDGDRGGDLILKQLLDKTEGHIRYVARAPEGKEVEYLSPSEIKEALANKVPVEQAVWMTGQHQGMPILQTMSTSQNGILSKSGKTEVIQTKSGLTIVRKKHSRKPHLKSTSPSSQSPTALSPSASSSSHSSSSTMSSSSHPSTLHSSSQRGRSEPSSSLSHSRVSSTMPPSSSSVSSSRNGRSFPRKPFRKDTKLPIKSSRQLQSIPPRVIENVKKLQNSMEAFLLDEAYNVLKSVPTSELYDTLSTADNVSSVILDGVATQRLLELAHRKNIKLVVAATTGSLTKKPVSVRVVTFDRML